ncbi:MAG: hypothetical protein LBH81_02170 [Rickettsiales bacterium]|jgi:hypothetical protein|nr:hypothetical protein [Rickettsiales bacterium]
MAIKYKYAYDKNERIVDIVTAVKGVTYHCISCGDAMITKQGKINKWHFAHKHEQDNCSAESYLHKLAKQKFYDIYSECLANNTPFYIQLENKQSFKPCLANNKFNLCDKCDYKRTKIEKIDLTKWFRTIEIEKTIDAFRADLCLANADDSENIFIEIHVTNKISDEKQKSKYRIIEIDIESEDDILSFNDKVLIPSGKTRFLNFKEMKSITANDGMCQKTFLLLFLNKDGSVNFKDDLNISELNQELTCKKESFVDYLVVQPEYCHDPEHCYSHETCWSHHNGASDYKRFIALCANKNLNVKSCFICRYHAIADSMWNTAPIFCKFLKKEFISTQAVKCQYFRKEDKYVNDLLENKEDGLLD